MIATESLKVKVSEGIGFSAMYYKPFGEYFNSILADMIFGIVLLGLIIYSVKGKDRWTFLISGFLLENQNSCTVFSKLTLLSILNFFRSLCLDFLTLSGLIPKIFAISLEFRLHLINNASRSSDSVISLN